MTEIKITMAEKTVIDDFKSYLFGILGRHQFIQSFSPYVSSNEKNMFGQPTGGHTRRGKSLCPAPEKRSPNCNEPLSQMHSYTLPPPLSSRLNGA